MVRQSSPPPERGLWLGPGLGVNDRVKVGVRFRVRDVANVGVSVRADFACCSKFEKMIRKLHHDYVL